MQNKGTRTYFELEKELSSNKLRQVYFISAFDSFFTDKFINLLRTKKFGNSLNYENFFVRYADETSLDDLFDLCSNFSSLFSSEKIILVKRAEKYSKYLDKLVEYSNKPDEATTLILVFDKDAVAEKKLYKNISFYDLSEMNNEEYINWVKDEIQLQGLEIKDDALILFITNVPQNFDLVYQEIVKISNYLSESKIKIIDVGIVMKLMGYEHEFSPNDLVVSILNKDSQRALKICDNILNNSVVSDIYLLFLLSGYYGDMLCFKSKNFVNANMGELYGKYRIWGDRYEFANAYQNKVSVDELESGFNKILQTDQKLKTSMLDPKILITSLVEELSKNHLIRN